MATPGEDRLIPNILGLAPAGLAILAVVAIVTAQQAVNTGAIWSQSQKNGKRPAVSIYGRVTINGREASGVTVQLMPVEVTVSQHSPIAEAITDGEGLFKISNIPAGSYRIEALALDCFMQDGSAGKPVKPIWVGESLERLDMALTRGGVITGRVISSDGEPVIGGTISLSQIDERGMRRLYLPSSYMSSTDDRGFYRIYGLPPGPYTVGVKIGLPGNTKSINAFHPDADREDKATVVDVAAGSETANVDITITEPVESPNPSETFKVRGKIVDADTGKALSNFPLNYNSKLRGEFSVGLGFNLRTNSKGEFQINDVSPGSYFIYASTGEGSNLFSDVLDFEVVDSDVTGLEVNVHTGSSISGTVVINSPQDQKNFPNLTDQEFIVSVTTAAGNSIPVSFKPEEDGTFQVSGLPPGKANFSLSGYPNPSKFQSMRVERNTVEQKDGINISPGEQVNDVRIVLLYNPGRIVGQLKFVGGTIPEGRQLYIYPRPVRAGGPGRLAPVESNGRFIIENLVGGDYQLDFFPFFGFPSRPKSPDSSSSPEVVGSGFSLPTINKLVTVTPGQDSRVTITVKLSQKEESE